MSMKAQIWNGSRHGDDRADSISTLMTETLTARGYEARHFRMRELKIKPCIGCSRCYTTKPGECGAKDDTHSFIPEIPQQDLVVMVTPLMFGGFTSTLKRAIDRCNPMATAFVVREPDATHFVGRYDSMPKLIFVGLNEQEDSQGPNIFRILSERASRSLQSSSYDHVVFTNDDDDHAVTQGLNQALGQ